MFHYHHGFPKYEHLHIHESGCLVCGMSCQEDGNDYARIADGDQHM